MGRLRPVRASGTDRSFAAADDLGHRGGDGGKRNGLGFVRRDAPEAVGEFLVDKAGRQVAGNEARMLHDGRQELHVVVHAADIIAIERPAHFRDRLVPGRAVADQLGDHRVVVNRDFGAFADSGVDPDGFALLRRDVAHQPADRGQEAAQRIFGVDPAFHRPAGQSHVFLAERQFLAGGDADHLLDQIEAGDLFGYRMLDLQPRIHLQEVEIAVLVDDELDGSGRAVADVSRQGDRLFAHGAAGRFVEKRRRRLLDHLLVPPLDRAFALAEIDGVAVAVGQHLDFDMARVFDELLDEHPVVGKGTARLV